MIFNNNGSSQSTISASVKNRVLTTMITEGLNPSELKQFSRSRRETEIALREGVDEDGINEIAEVVTDNEEVEKKKEFEDDVVANEERLVEEAILQIAKESSNPDLMKYATVIKMKKCLENRLAAAHGRDARAQVKTILSEAKNSDSPLIATSAKRVR